MVLLFFLPPVVLPVFAVVFGFFVTLVDVFANDEPVLALDVALAFAGAGAAAGAAAVCPEVAAAAAGFFVKSAF